MATTQQLAVGKTRQRKGTKRNIVQNDQVTVAPSKSPYFGAPGSSHTSPKLSKTSQIHKVSDPNASQMAMASVTSNSKKLGEAFFKQPCIRLAKDLLGQVLVRVVGGERLAGRIVETEAYVGEQDTACHTFNGRQTPSNKSMFLHPGHAYVYMTYGMYHCINITSNGKGEAVLLRALSPVTGAAVMTDFRDKASKRKNREFKTKDLCNGPGKLCMAMDIDRSMDGTDLTTSNALWVESGDCGGDNAVTDTDIVSCPRIGIDSATKEWVEKPLRFYVKGDPCVSKRNRTAEADLVATAGK